MVVLKIIYIISIFILFFSYVLYPFILRILHFFKKRPKQLLYEKEDAWPFVSVIMAAYNEEEVICQKVESVFRSNYPDSLFEMWIGSDNSTDNTHQLLDQLCLQFPNLHVIKFTERQGKKNIMNQLVDKAKGDIIVSTDANVLFHQDTLVHLVKYFKDQSIGLVDSMMTHHGIVPTGISFQESRYISREVRIKYFESQLWGSMMGPFGGCFAIRKNLYRKVPLNFLMDDFYINMGVLEQGYKTINAVDAKVSEDISNQLAEEFRRKIRIAAGNFQNLQAYMHLLNPFRKRHHVSPAAISFCFFSHKVLRWFGPLMILLIALCGIALLTYPIYFYTYLLFLLSLLFVPVDMILKKAGIHTTWMRFATHFYSTNLAMLLGLINYLKGVKTNVWQPTRRNQSKIQA